MANVFFLHQITTQCVHGTNKTIMSHSTLPAINKEGNYDLLSMYLLEKKQYLECTGTIKGKE